MDDETAAALRDLVALADSLAGQFRPEFDLGYWSGVEGAEPWYVRFEGDIKDTEFTVLGLHGSRGAAEGGRRGSAASSRSRAVAALGDGVVTTGEVPTCAECGQPVERCSECLHEHDWYDHVGPDEHMCQWCLRSDYANDPCGRGPHRG